MAGPKLHSAIEDGCAVVWREDLSEAWGRGVPGGLETGGEAGKTPGVGTPGWGRHGNPKEERAGAFEGQGEGLAGGAGKARVRTGEKGRGRVQGRDRKDQARPTPGSGRQGAAGAGAGAGTERTERDGGGMRRMRGSRRRDREHRRASRRQGGEREAPPYLCGAGHVEGPEPRRRRRPGASRLGDLGRSKPARPRLHTAPGGGGASLTSGALDTHFRSPRAAAMLGAAPRQGPAKARDGPGKTPEGSLRAR